MGLHHALRLARDYRLGDGCGQSCGGGDQQVWGRLRGTRTCQGSWAPASSSLMFCLINLLPGRNLGSLSFLTILPIGGIKPNVSSFGADQFNDADPQDRREKESFFNYFYLALNIGSLIACTVIVYIQDSYSWTLGFAIPGWFV